jgi:hypothetical protein
MKNMNQNVEQNEESETIARAIWEGKTIMARTDVKTNIRGGGFLPPIAQ